MQIIFQYRFILPAWQGRRAFAGCQAAGTNQCRCFLYYLLPSTKQQSSDFSGVAFPLPTSLPNILPSTPLLQVAEVPVFNKFSLFIYLYLIDQKLCFVISRISWIQIIKLCAYFSILFLEFHLIWLFITSSLFK